MIEPRLSGGGMSAEGDPPVRSQEEPRASRSGSRSTSAPCTPRKGSTCRIGVGGWPFRPSASGARFPVCGAAAGLAESTTPASSSRSREPTVASSGCRRAPVPRGHLVQHRRLRALEPRPGPGARSGERSDAVIGAPRAERPRSRWGRGGRWMAPTCGCPSPLRRGAGGDVAGGSNAPVTSTAGARTVPWRCRPARPCPGATAARR